MITGAQFHFDIQVVPDDIDELGHVSNQRYLRWVMIAAEDHSTAVGLPFETYREQGAIFVVRRHEIDYLVPALCDQHLRVETWIDSWAGASCVRKTIVRRISDDKVMVTAATKWVYFNLDRQRPARIPPQIIEHFA